MYSLKYGHLNVFFDRQSEALGDGGVKKAPDTKESPEAENKRKQWLKETIDAIGKKDNKSEAIKELQDREKQLQKTPEGKTPKQYKDDIDLLQIYIGKDLFDEKGKVKGAPGTRLDPIKKAFKISDNTGNSPEKQKAIEEFKKKSPTAYKDELLNYCIAHPQLSEHGDYLKKKQDEIKSLGVDNLPEYNAIVETLISVVHSKEFEKNTGFFANIWLEIKGKTDRAKDYKTILNNKLDEAIAAKKSVKVEFNNKEWQRISPESEKYIKENPTNKIENRFIEELKKGKLVKSNILQFIDNEEKKIKDQNLPPSYLDPYNKLFIKLRVLANNEVLYKSSTSIGQLWNNTTIDKYIAEAEKGKGKDGAIGYSNSNFRFFTIEELKKDIMETGDVGNENKGINIPAWEGYLNGVGTDYKKLETIFGKLAFESIAMYLGKRGFESRLTNKNPQFKEYIKGYYNELAQARDLRDLGKVSGDGFTELRSQLKITGPIEIITDEKGQINPFQTLNKYITDGMSPNEIEAIKKAFESDLARISSKAAKDKEQSVKELNDKKLENFTGLFDYLGITITDDIKVIASQSLNYNFKKEEAIKLLSAINKKETELTQELAVNKDPKKKEEIIAKLAAINNARITLKKQAVVDNAGTANEASKSVEAKDVVRVIKKPKEQKNIINVAELARRSVNQKENIKGIKEKIPKTLYEEYGLPADLETLKSPKKWNILVSAIAKLEDIAKKRERTTEENQLLGTLYDIRSLHRDTSKVISDIEQSIKSDPSSSDIYKNVIQNNKVLSNLEKSDLAIYRHMAEFRNNENQISSRTETIAKLPIGERISFDRLSGSNELPSNIGSTISLGKCSIEKTSITECTIYFDNGSGISPAKSIPIIGIGSFMEQANTYADINCPRIIEQIPFINECISKKTGKNTSSFDGIFDPFEKTRNCYTIGGLLGIERLPGQSLEEFSRSIKQKFPTENSITSRLIEQGVLRQEGGCNKSVIEQRIGNVTYPA